MIYFLMDADRDEIKIGTTIRLSQRLKQIESVRKTKLRVLGVMDGAYAEETALHAKFAHLRRDGEWFAAYAELVGFVAVEAREWDGTDEAGSLVSAKMDADVVATCRIAAAFKRISLTEYVSESLRDIVVRDIEEGFAARFGPKAAQESAS